MESSSGGLQGPCHPDGDQGNLYEQPPCIQSDAGGTVNVTNSRKCCCSQKSSKRKDEELGGVDSANTVEEGSDASNSNTNHGRKWKYFPGNNHFYCGGRIMTAPSIRYCSLSLALILVTFGLFIIFDAPFLTKRLTIAIPIISSILFVLVIVNMLRTSCSDPGILPRASLAEVEDMERSYGTTAATYRPPPRTKDIIVNGQTVKSKYCFTCKMFRPPRASHCSICDNCVERFDHHCPFLGNCVGRRNYRSFYFFVVSLSLLAVLILSCSITHLALLAKDSGDFLGALRESPTSAVVIIVSFFGMWTVIGLAGFHTYLIAVEQTTNEDIKGIFGRPNSKNPYSRGSTCRNCCFILCGPSPPSLLDPRGLATPDFLDSLQKPKNVQNGAIVMQQQPSRAPPPSVEQSAVPSHHLPSSPISNGVDVSHLTSRPQEQQTALQRQTAVNVHSNTNGNLVQEPLRAGTFPDALKPIGNGNERWNGVTRTVGNPHRKNGAPPSQSLQEPTSVKFQNQSKNPSEFVSMVPLSKQKSPKNVNSSTSTTSVSTASVRKFPNKTESSPTKNGSSRNPSSSLELLTMINSPLHLDPVT